MQIVNFQCGNCNRLMGVSSEFLGKQVRCPHCQQIVVAPPPIDEPSLQQPADFPDLTPASRDDHEHEDIFTPPEADDLFGSAPVSRLEMPPDRPPPTFAPAHRSEPGDTLPLEPMQSAPVDATLPYPPDSQHGTAFESSSPEEAPEESPLPSSVRRKPQARAGFPMFLIILPLLSYGVIVTVMAVMLYNKWRATEGELVRVREDQSPFDLIPDVDGDAPAPKGEPSGGQSRLKVYEDVATHPMPDRLKVGLGKTLKLGDLEVTPLRVERRKVRILDERFPNEPQEQRFDSVVLYLRLSNVSESLPFAPLDNYFDRRRIENKVKRDPEFPFTQLEIGTDRFFGGPCEWIPLNMTAGERKLRAKENKTVTRCWLEGRGNDPRLDPASYPVLQPGQTAESFVCTDGNNEQVVTKLNAFRGPLLYRVQLRRGLITYKGKRYPATTVIGVEFSSDDIKRAS